MSVEDVKARLADAEKIRMRCVAAKLPERANRYIIAGMTPEEVGNDLFDVMVARQGPEIDSRIPERLREQRLSENLYAEIVEADRIAEAHAIVTSPASRKRLLRIVKKGARNFDDRLLFLEARGIYALVYRDQLDDTGRYPKDMNDYLMSKAWAQKFKGSRGGRTRQVPAEWLAVRLAVLFEEFTGLPCWEIVADVVHQLFPVLSIPNGTSRALKKRNIGYRRRHWARELTKRYAKWAATFRPRA